MGLFKLGQDHGCLLGGPALGPPTKAFLTALAGRLVADGKISVRLDAVLAFGVFPVAHAWEAGLIPLHVLSPLSLLNLSYEFGSVPILSPLPQKTVNLINDFGAVPTFRALIWGQALIFTRRSGDCILSPPCPHFLGERGVFRGSVR